jgi:hypothetical protein
MRLLKGARATKDNGEVSADHILVFNFSRKRRILAWRATRMLLASGTKWTATRS